MKIAKNGLIVLFLFFLAGCTQMSPDPEPLSVDFNFTLSGIYSQKISNSETRAFQSVTANMTIFSHSDQSEETIPWDLSIDEETMSVTSSMTHNLETGQYDFTLNIIMGNRVYTGTSTGVVISSSSTIPLIIRPVIGNSVPDISVNTLSRVRFSYSTAELENTADPRIGFILNGGDEEIIILNKSTGISEVYLNLSEGSHSLALMYYDGATLTGKSLIHQQNILVVPGENIVMDIEPFTMTIQSALSIDGGRAEFNLTLPSIVVQEAGGLANLRAVLKISGRKNTPVEKEITFSLTTGYYKATAVIDSFHYDDMALSLEISDGAELIARGNTETFSLNSASQTALLKLDLHRRSLITGTLLSKAAIHVYDIHSNNLMGASVSANGIFKGITSSQGYLSFTLPPGDHILSAEKDGYRSEIQVHTNPLEVNNYDIELQPLTRVIKVRTGLEHILYLKDDNSLWVSGNGQYGSLGTGSTLNERDPVEIMKDVIDMSTMNYHSLAVKSDNSLWTFGNNFTGLLGDGTTDITLIPIKIMDGVEAVSAGIVHSLVLKNDGTLWAFGDNYYGVLGVGTHDNHLSPVRIAEGVKYAAAGSYSTYYIKEDNTLWATGYNNHGQLGDGTKESRLSPVMIMENVKNIFPGMYHLFIEKIDGTFWSNGFNDQGQLGHFNRDEALAPVQLTIFDNIRSLHPGEYSTMAIKNDNSLWAVGSNSYGNLGDGTRYNRVFWVKVTDNVLDAHMNKNSTTFLKEDYSVWYSGVNTFSHLTRPVTQQFISEPILIFR